MEAEFRWDLCKTRPDGHSSDSSFGAEPRFLELSWEE